MLKLLLLLILPSTTFASDKGICAEVREGALKLTCETTIIRDVHPLMDIKHHLEISKMSQESLEDHHRKMDEIWASVSKTHQAALSGSGWTGRLGSVDPEYLKSCAEQAWALARKKCPKRATSADSQWVLFEILKRYLATPATGP